MDGIAEANGQRGRDNEKSLKKREKDKEKKENKKRRRKRKQEADGKKKTGRTSEEARRERSIQK